MFPFTSVSIGSYHLHLQISHNQEYQAKLHMKPLFFLLGYILLDCVFIDRNGIYNYKLIFHHSEIYKPIDALNQYVVTKILPSHILKALVFRVPQMEPAEYP